MAKLTRYKRFKELKLSTNSIIAIGPDYSKEMKEFEHFIALLRKSSTLTTKKPKKSKAYNE